MKHYKITLFSYSNYSYVLLVLLLSILFRKKKKYPTHWGAYLAKALAFGCWKKKHLAVHMSVLMNQSKMYNYID